jgi:NAD(P)-dependent dehydrogenase (short-subunit alcohol dehydrogenase family)
VSPVALVTGANRGIGLEICRQLADRDFEVILTARDEAKARAAAEELWAEGLDTVHPRVLDVASDASVERLRERVEQEFSELHALVNNAGVGLDFNRSVLEPDFDAIRATLETNTLGALRVASAFLPLVERSGAGRIVNVSSGMGGVAEMGGGSPGYRISKAGLNAVTRMLAAELAGTGILVNSACPGFVQTDMGGPDAPKTVAEGADTPVWLATLPDDGPTGGFFRNRRAISF